VAELGMAPMGLAGARPESALGHGCAGRTLSPSTGQPVHRPGTTSRPAPRTGSADCFCSCFSCSSRPSLSSARTGLGRVPTDRHADRRAASSCHRSGGSTPSTHNRI
jgi:hypothetical protein